MYRACIGTHNAIQSDLRYLCIEAEDTSDSDEGEIEVNEHGDMASDDASDGFEEETITNEPASDEDGALDDDVEVPREGYEDATQC